MKKLLYNCISLFDIYGVGFALRYHSHESYKTALGAFFGLLSMLSILILSIFFLKDLFNRTNFSVIANQEQSLPQINLSSFPFLFSFGSVSSSHLDNERLYNYTLQLQKYFTTNSSVTQRTTQDIQMETCDINKHFGDYRGLFSDINVTLYKCIVPGQNITLFNRFGDNKNGFQILSLYINKCDSSKRPDCFSKEEMNERIANSYLNFQYGTYSIDHYNYTNPTQKTIRGELFRFTSKLIKRYFYKLSQSVYITDRGLIFHDYVKDDFYKFNSFYVDIDTDQTAYDDQSIGTIIMSCNDTVMLYQRTYPKAQNIIASIGSLASLILYLCQVLVKLLTKKMMIANATNELLPLKSNRSKANQQLSVLDTLIPRNPTFSTVSPRNKRRTIQLSSLSSFNPKAICNKTNEHLNLSHKIVRNYKLKIKKATIDPLSQVNEAEREGNPMSKTLSLSFLDLFIPKVFTRSNSKVRLLYQTEAFVFKYLSIETMIPLLEKIEHMWKDKASNGQFEEFDRNNSVSNGNNNKFNQKLTFAPIAPEQDRNINSEYYYNKLFNS